MKNKKNDLISYERLEGIQLGTFAVDAGYFPVLVKKEGKLYVFFRSHAGHIGKTGKVSVSASSDGLIWGKPYVAAEGKTDCRNPSIGVLKDGSFLLSTLVYDCYDSNDIVDRKQKFVTSMAFFSSIDGKEWGIAKKESIAQSPFGRISYFKDRLLMPAYSPSRPHCLLSDSEGRKWDEVNLITKGFHEPAILPLENELIVALRGWGPDVGSSGTHISRSEDGKKWSEPELVTEGCAHPADLTKLSNGYILLTYGARNPKRQRIMMRLSPDNGKTWLKSLQLSDKFLGSDFGYPSTVEIRPGELVTVFYHQAGAEAGFRHEDPKRYDPEWTRGYSIVYSLDELMEKSKQ